MTIASDPAAAFTAPLAGESPVALWRLYLLRAGHLLIAGGLQIWSTYTSRLSRATNQGDPHKVGAIRAMTLHVLCRELSCQPSELLEFVPCAEGAVARGQSQTWS